jgi:hypothetical protein
MDGTDPPAVRRERNKNELPVSTINRIWRWTRAAVFTPEVMASPLAENPSYDLRHAAVSTWLNAGISPTQVAEWAGQSPEVLWRNYAKCLRWGGRAPAALVAGYGADRHCRTSARIRHRLP